MSADIHTPQTKGKPLRRIDQIKLTKWGVDRELTFKVKVSDPPRLSASGKAYIYAFKQGESDIVVNLAGVDRKVRLTCIIYVKVPSSERRATFKAEAERFEAEGHPKLY